MNLKRVWQTGTACAFLLAGSGCIHSLKAPASGDTPLAAADRLDLAGQLTAEWSNQSRLAARRLIEEYGAPDEVRYGRLVWNRKGPWKRIVVRDIRPAYVEGDELGLVEQSVDYALMPPPGGGRSAFPDGVAYDPNTGELSARSDREELNFLRLNLADDVARGRLTAPEAKDSYAKIVELEMAGKSSPDLHRLRLGSAPAEGAPRD